MEMQLAKAEKIVRMWGVPERRLRAWLDAGIVATIPSRARGRGNLRLLTDASLTDAFLAARLSHDFSRVWVKRCLQAARPHYADIVMIDGPNQIVFELKHPQHEIQVAVMMEQLQRTLDLLRHTPQAMEIRRGRKSKRWQDEFAELASEIGKELRAAEPGLPPVHEAIRAYRASRGRGKKELRVAVPA